MKRNRGPAGSGLAMKLYASGKAPSLKAAWAMVKKGKGKGKAAKSSTAAAPKRRAKRRPMTFSRIVRRTKPKARKTTVYRRSRGHVSSVGVAGKGTVFAKSGRKVRRAKFRKQVAVHMTGGKHKHLRVMFKNAKGKKARKPAPFNAPPPAAGSVQYGTQEDRDMERLASISDPVARRKEAQRIFGRAYPTKYSKVKRTVYDRVPRVLGGFKIGYKGKGKSRRPVYTVKGQHIQMWQAVGAPSPLYYRKYPEEFAAERDAILARRTARSGGLKKQIEQLARRASAVEEAGDMYTPNRRRSKKSRSKGRSRKGRTHVRMSAKRQAKRTAKRSAKHHAKRRMRRNEMVPNRKHRKHAKRHHHRGMKVLVANKKRRRALRGRRMRRNAALAAYMPSLQTAGAALGGLVGQRVLKYLLGSMVFSKVDAVPVEYKGVLSSLVSAAVLVPVAAKAMPDKAVVIGAGALVGLGLDLLTMLVTRVYPDGVMYLSGYGADIPMRNITGWGSYEPVSGYGVLPYAQAAAGLGISYDREAAKYGAMGEYMPQGRFPVQAAAGYGVLPYAQAAAGYGLASYEPVSGAAVYDGIGADQASAEAALNAADAMSTPMQAAAGFGDIPSQNIWIPGPEQDPSKAISGYGGEGIFADPTF